MNNPANRELGPQEPGRRALLALTGNVLVAAALHRFSPLAYACTSGSERTRSNGDSARIVIDERRAILDRFGNPTRYEPAFGNHHVILAPTKAQLDNFRSLFTGGRIEDMTVNDLLEMGIRAAVLQTKEDERTPGFGRMWTSIFEGLDSEKRRKWRWGADHASIVGYPEFTKKLEGCEGDFPAHLIFLAKVEANNMWGIRLELHHEEVVAVNCSPDNVLITTKVEQKRSVPSLPGPEIPVTPNVTVPRPQLPPAGPGAPQVPQNKSEIIIVPDSLLAEGNPYNRLAI